MTLGVGGILRQEPAAIVRRLTFATKEAAAPEHRDLFDAMARVNLAHVVMMSDLRLVPADVSAKLCGALAEILREGPASVPLRAEAGDLYPQIEAHLSDRLGSHVSGYLQLGRSRGDVLPAAMHLKVRCKMVKVLRAQLGLRRALLGIIADHLSTIMPAYTHYQQSQIVTLAHVLGRFVAWFERDTARFHECLARHNLSALGAANGVGTGVALDRASTAHLLGHSGPIPSAGDATNAWDYMIEPVAHAALFCSHAGRLADNLILWHMQEMAMFALSDAFATASTYLPHKKNPEPLETVRVVAQHVAGDLAAVFLMARNEDFPHSLINHGFPAINHSLDASVDCAELLAACLADGTFRTERMAELAGSSFATSSQVAHALMVRFGLPFREAHELVGFAVSTALQSGRKQLNADDLRSASEAIVGRILPVTEDDIRDAADSRKFVDRMTSAGGTSPVETAKLLAEWTEALGRDEARLAVMCDQFDAADHELLARAAVHASGSDSTRQA